MSTMTGGLSDTANIILQPLPSGTPKVLSEVDITFNMLRVAICSTFMRARSLLRLSIRSGLS